jgi:hypothetical protein
MEVISTRTRCALPPAQAYAASRSDPARQSDCFSSSLRPIRARKPPLKGVLAKRSPVPLTGASQPPKFHASLQRSKWRAGTLRIARAELQTATKDFRPAGETGIGAALQQICICS